MLAPARRLTAAALLAGALALPAGPAAAQIELPQASPKARVEQSVGITQLAVAYSSPGVKGRKIWGEVVPFGQVWRTGANEATTFTSSRDFTFGGTKVPAGTYSLFTIPAESKWTVVLNANPKTWGSFDYDAAKDVARWSPLSEEDDARLTTAVERINSAASVLVEAANWRPGVAA